MYSHNTPYSYKERERLNKNTFFLLFFVFFFTYCILDMKNKEPRTILKIKKECSCQLCGFILCHFMSFFLITFFKHFFFFTFLFSFSAFLFLQGPVGPSLYPKFDLNQILILREGQTSEDACVYLYLCVSKKDKIYKAWEREWG